VQWVHQDQPGHLNRAAVLYRDRLVNQGGEWLISRRKLDLLMQESSAPLPAGVTLPNSVLDLADRS